MDALSLADQLVGAADTDIVRLVAQWIDRATAAAPDLLDLSTEPALTGRRHLDALVAAAAAHAARVRGMDTPAWTIGAQRMVDTFWYPGPPALFPNALVHAPGEFAVRGVFIEADSLVCV